jgi:hypothetical protein
LGVTDGGVRVHDEPDGAPVQANEICSLKLPSGLIARVEFADRPAFTVEAPEEAEREKSLPVHEGLTVRGLGAALSVTESVLYGDLPRTA